jgi:hypothetical protein
MKRGPAIGVTKRDRNIACVFQRLGNIKKLFMTLRYFQAKLFELMQKFEFDASKVDGVKMGRMIADLARAGISQKKLAREIREETRLAAAEDAASAATAQGLSKDTVNFIRAKVLGQEI